MQLVSPDTPTIRARCIEARRRMSPAQRSAASDSIVRQLLRSRLFARSCSIGVYLAMSDEVDLDSFVRVAWACGKRVFVPRILRKHEMFFVEMRPESQLVRNHYGIWEVDDDRFFVPRSLDWIILPMVAFDAEMHRVGMGGGYYDRALAFARHGHACAKPRLTGVAFARQQVARLHANPWDIGVSRVFTE